MSKITARGLYTFPGLAKLIDTEGLKLSDDTNRFFMSHILSKVGITVGQKIAQKRKQVVVMPKNRPGQ